MSLTITPTSTIVVSMSDIMRHPHFKETVDKSRKWKPKYDPDPKPKWLNTMLWKMGLNYNRRYDVSKCLHRAPLSDRLVTCERFYGMERTDKEWVDFKKKLWERELYDSVDSRKFS